MRCEGDGSSPIVLLDDTSPEQLLELTLEVLGLVERPQDMGAQYASVSEG